MPRQSKPVRATKGDDVLLNEQQVLDLFNGNISARTLRLARDTRQIDYVRTARGCLYWRSAVDAWLERRTVRAEL